MSLEKAKSIEAGLQAVIGLPEDYPEALEKVKKMSICDRIKFTISNITVEPLLIFYILPSIMVTIAIYNLNLEKACRVNLGISKDHCDALTIRNKSAYVGYKEDEERIQTLATQMQIVKNTVQSIIPGIMLLFLGAWSDRHQKRKSCMMVPILGDIAMVVGLLVCTYYYYELPIEMNSLFESFFPAISGSWFAMFTGVYSYISDVSNEEERTMRVGAVNMLSNVSMCIGTALSGVLYEAIGFYGVFSTALIMYLIGFSYAYFCIQDTCNMVSKDGKLPVKIESRGFFRDFFQAGHVVDTLKTVIRSGNKRGRKKRVSGIMFLFIVIVGPLYEPSTSGVKRCEVCTLDIPTSRYSGHLRTLQHRSRCTVVQEEGVELIRTSFRNRLATYRLPGTSAPTDVKRFLQHLKSKTVKLIGECVKKFNNIKVGMELFGRFILQTKETVEVKSFLPKFQLVSGSSDLEELFNQLSTILEKKMQEFQEKESGELNVVYYFVIKKFGWGSMEYSYFSTYQFVTNTLGTSFSLAVFSKYLKLDDSILGIISCSTKIMAAGVYAFASSAPYFYLAATIELFNGTSFIAMRAMITKLVAPEELGKINSLFGVGEAIVPLIYGPLYSRVYAKTIDTFPGCFYLVGGGLTFPAVFIFYWLYQEHKKDLEEAENLKLEEAKPLTKKETDKCEDNKIITPINDDVMERHETESAS